ncbi:MAG: hypothetical protein R2682_00605 [Pyrinomonadaceae bacterium]
MKTVNLFVLCLVIFAFTGLVSAQGFKGLIPLESTCEDVKRVLNVEKCTVPFSVYFLKDYMVGVHFKTETPSEDEKWCYKVPVGTVTSLTVSYNKPFPLKDFEYRLEYAEGPFGDVDTTAYKNEEKGVSVFVNLGRINTANFMPTPDQRKKYAYDCRSGCKQGK